MGTLSAVNLVLGKPAQSIALRNEVSIEKECGGSFRPLPFAALDLWFPTLAAKSLAEMGQPGLLVRDGVPMRQFSGGQREPFIRRNFRPTGFEAPIGNRRIQRGGLNDENEDHAGNGSDCNYSIWLQGADVDVGGYYRGWRRNVGRRRNDGIDEWWVAGGEHRGPDDG